MPNTWVVDLRHYLAPTGAIADIPSRAGLLAEYFASIVVDATTNLDDPPTVRCRRWPGHRRCTGIVMCLVQPKLGVGNNGFDLVLNILLVCRSLRHFELIARQLRAVDLYIGTAPRSPGKLL